MTSRRKRLALSQNFLADSGVVRWIARTADCPRAGLVLEPGAGDGRLTVALARRAARVVAYEIDPVLAARLRDRCDDLPNVRCVPRDFLTARAPREPFAVVGNIPYAATSRIVDWCLTARALTSATLVTQLEYARKRAGGYGRWSKVTVLSWPRYDWRIAGRIDRHVFRPVPGVDSALLRLDRRPRPLLPGEAMGTYRDLVELGFTGRGGSLHASLRAAHPRRRLDAAFRAAELDRSALVGHVHPDRWIALFRSLSAGSGPGSGGASR